MITTEWMMGTVQDVVWTANGGHWGGYTYRLCKLPEEGPTAITEECFSKNILKFATNFTMIKPLNKHTDGGFDWGHGEEVEEKWEKFEQIDLSEGTFPEGSVWRPVGKFVQSATTLRKDSVRVPDNLEPGNYVLGWRWDAANISQVNVSSGTMICFTFSFQGLGFLLVCEARVSTSPLEELWMMSQGSF